MNSTVNQHTLLMQQVNIFLTQCGLSQYYDVFIEEGFDRPESLMEITETDLIQMEVKRGHRRLLQRAIANSKGIPSTVPLNIAPVIKPSSTASNNNSNNNVTGEFISTQFKIPYERKSKVDSNLMSDYNNSSSREEIMQPSEAMDVSLNMLNGNNISPLSTSSTSTTHSSISQKSPPTHTNNTTTNHHHHYNNNNHHHHHSSPSLPPTTSVSNEYFPSAGTMTHSAQSGMSSTEEEAVTSDNVHRLWKRKYHRHAKPDNNAPLKPPSAYVMFSNDVRLELKQQNKSFTDLAKIIGDRWKNISPKEKELYESNALKSREDYFKKLEEYHKTEQYRTYQQYLSDFKAENEAAARPVGRPRKRHRKDDYASDGTMSDSVPSGSGIATATVRVIPLNTNINHSRNNSITTDNNNNSSTTPTSATSTKQYPFYLLNEEGFQKQQVKK